MRTVCQAILFVIMSCCLMAAQTISPDFKFEGAKKPGEQATIKGADADMDKVTSVALRPEGKSDGKSDLVIQKFDKKPDKTEISFTVPDAANGKYTVIVTPPGNTSIPLTVTPAQTQQPAAPAPTPVIDSVFPTTTFPTQKRFSFEINGRNFSPKPEENEIEVEGQGRILFAARHVSPPRDAIREAGKPIECKQEQAKNYPCLEVTADGHTLLISGFERRNEYQGPMRVKVVVNGVPSVLSSSFTLSRVDARIIIWLTFALFGLLMYIVYRLVSKGIADYTIAGRKYSPLAAFFIDKTTDSYSLSKFQLFALSMIAFFGYVYVFLCRALVQWNFTFPDIPDNYPSLLAISAGTTVAAVGLNSTRGTKGGGPVYPSAADFISNGGLVVAERFQFFVWTLIACIGFIALILMQDPAKIDGFPTFPTGLLYVMGVSAGGYLGGKAVRGAGPILKQVQVQVNANGVDLDVVLHGENLDKNGKFRIDGATQAAVTTVTGDEQPQGPKGYCTRLTFVLSQAAGFAQGDHTFEITNSDGVGAQEIFTATPMKITNATAITHGTTGPVTLTVENYREGSTARWMAPFASVPAEIAAADVKKIGPAAGGGDVITVTVAAGDKTGTGTLTLVSKLGGTEATAVTVN